MTKHFDPKSAKTPPESSETSLKKLKDSDIVCLPDPRNYRQFSQKLPSRKGKKGGKGARSKGVDEKLVPITNFFKKEAKMEHMNSIGERNPHQDEANFEVGNRTMAD